MDEVRAIIIARYNELELLDMLEIDMEGLVNRLWDDIEENMAKILEDLEKDGVHGYDQ